MTDPSRLHVAHQTELIRLRNIVLAQVLVSDGPSAAVPIVLEGQRRAVSVTDAYLSLEAGLATGTSTEPWGIDPEPLIGRAARGGVWLEDVYGRNWQARQSTFQARMAREVATDLMLAQRSATWVHTAGDRRIRKTRRVITSAKACGLCIVAATQLYSREELRPLHRGCMCTTQPVYIDAAAPKVDKAFLNDLYERAGGTSRHRLRRLHLDAAELPAGVRAEDLPAVAVTFTRELGPTLTPAA